MTRRLNQPYCVYTSAPANKPDQVGVEPGAVEQLLHQALRGGRVLVVGVGRREAHLEQRGRELVEHRARGR